MYKLEFTLKQHTPLIHFQHNQDGATLRATEVKPKLDRYIIEKLTKKSGEEAIAEFKANAEWKKWLVGKGEHPALDYKLSLTNSSGNNYFLPLPMSFTSKNHPDRDQNLIKWISQETGLNISLLEPTLFFANADKIKFSGEQINEYESKVNMLNFAVHASERIKASIVSMNQDIITFLKNNINDFFLLNNFGTRQNKGFGSFTVFAIDNRTVQIPNLSLLFLFRSNNNFPSHNRIFKFIKEEYQSLKSGVNHPTYSKSKLFEHFVNLPTNPIRWEKRYFKQFINLNRLRGKILYKRRYDPIDFENRARSYYTNFTDRQVNNYKFVRALLGLSEQFEFLIDDATGRPDNRDKYIVSIKHKPARGSEAIDRFKSPLFYKVIDGYVYIKADQSFNSILNEEFDFALKLKSSPGSSVVIPPLRVPASFNLSTFLSSNISANWTTNF